MTVIRDQGNKKTQLLEIMAKQQNEAQTAAAAAMIARMRPSRVSRIPARALWYSWHKGPRQQCIYPRKIRSSLIGWRPDTSTHMATSSRPDPTNQGDPRHCGSTLRQARNRCRGLRALQGGTAEPGSVRQPVLLAIPSLLPAHPDHRRIDAGHDSQIVCVLSVLSV